MLRFTESQSLTSVSMSGLHDWCGEKDIWQSDFIANDDSAWESRSMRLEGLDTNDRSIWFNDKRSIVQHKQKRSFTNSYSRAYCWGRWIILIWILRSVMGCKSKRPPLSSIEIGTIQGMISSVSDVYLEKLYSVEIPSLETIDRSLPQSASTSDLTMDASLAKGIKDTLSHALEILGSSVRRSASSFWDVTSGRYYRCLQWIYQLPLKT